MNVLPFRSIDDIAVSVFPTGSAVICSPPVTDTDVDYLVLVGNLDECGARLSKYNWDNCFEDWVNKADTDPAAQLDGYSVEDQLGARFQAWRSGKLNVIVTDDMALYLRSCAATALAQQMNLLRKEDRISLFRAIKYGTTYLGPLP